MNRNVISVIDGGSGSSGKAKCIGEIATNENINLGAAVTNCMPNAGHTLVLENGQTFIFRNIPVSIINPKTELFIGPGSEIDMKIFIREYESIKYLLGDRKIYVHELVPIIEQRHKDYEKENIKTGSTFKGCAGCMIEKVSRNPELKFFKSYKNAVVCSNEEWLDRLHSHLDNSDEYAILEGAQGCDLSLNHSGNYPYVTSRNVSTAQLLADSGISPERLLGTIMVIRPFPIRISDITQSGEYMYTGAYGDALPLTWTQVNLAAKKGSYPYNGDVECIDHELTIEKVKSLLNSANTLSLMQVFGPNYQSIKVEDVNLLQALELERLYYKNKGKKRYSSSILVGTGKIEDLSEQTTVTSMERKIFDLDIKKLKQNIRINSPYGLYLNFAQQLDLSLKNKSGNFDDYNYNTDLKKYFEWLESETNTDILALGTGATNGDRISKKPLIRNF